MKKNKIAKITLIISIVVLLIPYVARGEINAPNDGPDWKKEDWSEIPGGINWAWEFIKLPLAWNITTGSKNVKIGIIDTSFDSLHEDLRENIISPLIITIPWDEHGTHVAGIVGAKGNNDKGIAGTMWDTTLLPYGAGIPFLGETSFAFAIMNMWFAIVRDGAKVINYSAGSDFTDLQRAESENKAWKWFLLDRFKDVVFVFAAGEKGVEDKYSSPSSIAAETGYDHVINVTASDLLGNLYSGSNYGDVEVAAPGATIYSTLPGNNYGEEGGTSMSAPFVSGLAGLIYSVDPSRYEGKYKGKVLTAKDVKELIVEGAKRGGKFVDNPAVPDDPLIPVINAYESLKLLITPPSPTLSILTITDITSSSATLSWTKNTDDDFKEYRLYRITVSSGFPPTDLVAVIANQSQTSFTDTNLPAGIYDYYLDTYNLANLSSRSNQVRAVLPFYVSFAPITVDGSINDWQGISPAIIDKIGDKLGSYSGTDIDKVYLARDDTYLYLRIDLTDGPPNPDFIGYHTNLSKNPELAANDYYQVSSYFTGEWRNFLYYLISISPWQSQYVYDDLAAAGTYSLEARTQLFYFNDPIILNISSLDNLGQQGFDWTPWVETKFVPASVGCQY